MVKTIAKKSDSIRFEIDENHENLVIIRRSNDDKVSIRILNIQFNDTNAISEEK